MRLKEFIAQTTKMLPFAALLMGANNMGASRPYEARKARDEAAQIMMDIRQELILDSNREIFKLFQKLETHIKEYNKGAKRRIINELMERLNNGDITPEEREFLSNLLNLENNPVNGIVNTIQSIKLECAEASNTITEISQSSSFSFLQDGFTTISNFMSSLSLEQLLAVMNILGLIIITSCLISIAIIFYGDYLIKYFKFEVKYPKFAKLIQLRRKFQFVYLNANFLLILPVIPILF